MDLEAELLALIRTAVRGSVSCIEEKRQASAPRATGELASSIKATFDGRSGDAFRVTVTQDADEAPHGPIIDNPEGGRITAKGKALGPFQHAGQTMFRRSVEQSTKHKGWWDDFEWVAEFESCLERNL